MARNGASRVDFKAPAFTELISSPFGFIVDQAASSVLKPSTIHSELEKQGGAVPVCIIIVTANKSASHFLKPADLKSVW